MRFASHGPIQQLIVPISPRRRQYVGRLDPPRTYDDLKEVVGLPGRPVFPGHHGGASGIATQGLKTMSLRRERELRNSDTGPHGPDGLKARGLYGTRHT